MSNFTNAISIYQSYSLEKISALNKKQLAIQYSQSEQIRQLEKSLSKDLRAVNRLNQQILDNQLKELKHKETIRFYRIIAFNAKEAVTTIEGQEDALFRDFLLKVYQKPIRLLLQDAKANLDEIDDLEFCSIQLKKLDCLEQAAQTTLPQFINSNYNILLSQEESYFKELDDLKKFQKRLQIERNSLNSFEAEPKLSLQQYQKRGCLTTTIIVTLFSFLIFLINITDKTNSEELAPLPMAITFIIAPILLLAYVWYRYYKRGQEYVQYASSIDMQNVEKLDKYKQNIEKLNSEEQSILQSIHTISTQHPYAVAKDAILSQNPIFEATLIQINNYLPDRKEDQPKRSHNNDEDEFVKIGRFITSQSCISITMMQRKFEIGFNKAGRFMDQFHQMGVVGPAKGSKPREVLVDTETFEKMLELYK